jgi:hypothetical protein
LFVTLPPVNPGYISLSARFRHVLRCLSVRAEKKPSKATIDRLVELR